MLSSHYNGSLTKIVANHPMLVRIWPYFCYLIQQKFHCYIVKKTWPAGGKKYHPHGIVLRRRRSHTGQENPRTSIPTHTWWPVALRVRSDPKLCFGNGNRRGDCAKRESNSQPGGSHLDVLPTGLKPLCHCYIVIHPSSMFCLFSVTYTYGTYLGIHMLRKWMMPLKLNLSNRLY